MAKPEKEQMRDTALGIKVPASNDTITSKLVEEASDQEEAPGFPDLIGGGITRCMYDRASHQKIEIRMDEWFKSLPANKEERVKKLQEAREQIETAKLALDAFYMRFRNLSATYKN